MKQQNKMYEMIPATGKNNSSFVGIKAKDDKIIVYYPESFRISPDSNIQKKEILSMIKSIQLAKSFYSGKNDVFVAENIGDNFLVDSYIYMLDDYERNHKYSDDEKVYLLNGKGRINWKRTLHQKPIINNGNILFDKFVVESKKQSNAIITEIYKYCVRVASEAIGWLVGVTCSEREKIPYNRNLYENVLNTALVFHSLNNSTK